MDASFVNPLNPFQQEFSDAEDFINILRQANTPFGSFNEPLVNELLPLQQVANSWIQLSLQSFGFAESPLTGPQDVKSLLGGPSLPSVTDSPPPAPGLQDMGGLWVGALLPAVPTPGMQDMAGFFVGAPLSPVPPPGPQDIGTLLVGAPFPTMA
jgi:hypothetical protein